MSAQTRTFQARIRGDHPALDATAELFSRVARNVDAALARGEDARTVARTLWKPNGISAKNLDHILRQVQAKRKAVAELAKVQADDLRTRIAAKERQIARKRQRLKDLPLQILALKESLADDRTSGALRNSMRLLESLPGALHQHARRLDRLKHLLLQAERRASKPGICHGSRELFLNQYHLAENGYADHAEWKRDWQAARSSQYMVEGDAACPTGNQFVRCKVASNGSFDLEVRLPPSLHDLAERKFLASGEPIACIDLQQLRFEHGHAEILAAIKARRPLTWRFIKDETSWRVMVMIGHEVEEEVGLDWSRGALGVDLNADHVALCHVSADGNPLRAWRIPLATYGLSEERRTDMVRKAARRIADVALELGLPVVSEKLDFARKKAELTSDHGDAYARALTSFAYRSFHLALRSALVRSGVRHVLVNPAYTSLIGRVKFARPYGLSVHAAAALSIARRVMGHSERVPATVHAGREGAAVPSLVIPLDSGDHVTLPAPVRMRSGPRGARRHVWSCWGRTFGQWKAAHEAHRRSARLRDRSASASGGPDGLKPADVATGVHAPIAHRRRRPSREDVGATAYPGAGCRAQARQPRRVSTRESE